MYILYVAPNIIVEDKLKNVTRVLHLCATCSNEHGKITHVRPRLAFLTRIFSLPLNSNERFETK